MILRRMNFQSNFRTSRAWKNCFCLTLLLFFLFSAISLTPVRAENEGSNIPISVENGGAVPSVLLSNDQQNPSIIALSDKNKWFVVWEDWRNRSTSGADIYGRFINADGTLCGDEIAISTAAGNQTVPTVAYRNLTYGSDNIMIAWQDSRGATSSGYIYYKFLDVSALTPDCSSGAVLQNTKIIVYKSINRDRLSSRKLPRLAYDQARDQFWMVWVESRDQVQRLVEYPFGFYGSPQWYIGDVNYIAYTTISASSAVSATPEILRNLKGSSLRTVRMISSTSDFKEDGGTVEYEYEYFTDINNVTIACDDSSPEALIAWEGVRGKATLSCKWTEKDDPEICHEEDDGDDGTVEVCEPNPDYGVPTGGDLYSSELTLEPAADDGKVHIYSIFDKYITQSVVHSQLVDSSDAPSYYPALAYDLIHRKFLVAWEDRGTRGDGVHSNIYGQLIYSGGGLYSSNFAISYQDLNDDGELDDDIRSTNQTRPCIAVDSINQRFLVTWQDGRNSDVATEDLDIYAQYVDSEGSLRGYNFAVCAEEFNQYNPVTAYNFANHQYLTIWKDARNLNTTNSDIFGQRFTSEQQPQFILLNGVYVAPASHNFPNCEVGDSTVLNVMIVNILDSDVQVKKAFTSTDAFSVSGIADGDIVSAGATLICQVTFAPTAPGSFGDALSIDIGSVQASGTVESTESVRYTVQLQGNVNADFFIAENDTFTAASAYRVTACASTNKSGRLFVLLSHAPLSYGVIYAMDRNGNLVAFPAHDSSAWQNLWYMEAAAPGLELDLSRVDFRDLGCTQCQSQKVDEGASSVSFGGFGNIIITPTSDKESVNNAADFKYMPGILYVATYLKDPSVIGMFDFNEGLLEMQVLSINSLNGTWKVISRYNGENRMHAASLEVNEPGDGNISAVWPGYNVGMDYGSDESAYIMNFSIGIYNYIYKITSLTNDSFTAEYSCTANGEVLDSQPVCGVRRGSVKDQDGWLCPGMR